MYTASRLLYGILIFSPHGTSQDVNGQNGYIAAMGPLTATLDDYWRMLWEYGIRVSHLVVGVAD